MATTSCACVSNFGWVEPQIGTDQSNHSSQGPLPRPFFCCHSSGSSEEKKKKSQPRDAKNFQRCSNLQNFDSNRSTQRVTLNYCYERNVRLRRPANPGCSRYAHTAAAAAAARHTAPTTNHHRAPTLRMFTASAGGAGR